MGDKETLSKARRELEELYLGVPDDSVNLTFQDLAQVRHVEMKKPSPPKTVAEKQNSSSNLAKLPSLDFNRGLESASSFQTPNISSNHYTRPPSPDPHRYHADANYSHHDHRPADDHRGHAAGDHRHHHHHHHLHRSVLYDDVNHASGMSMSMSMSTAYGTARGGGRRRPGIPHSNTCTVCSNYIYICRHRCLVCGRAYCRQCVSIGMGEMSEGRKCIECLGRRFSQRYIKKAGNVGCCMGYSSAVKQQELKWAEKGPRRSGENNYGGRSVVVSRPRSPVGTTPSPGRQYSASNTPSFVVNSPYSPTSHHPMPF